MQPPHGIEPREGAELSKRVGVCQRSSQGAKAPQRSVRAARGRDSLPRHLELTRTSAKGSFSFIEGSAEIASRNLASEWDAFSALRPLGKARPGSPASEWDVLSFCGLWRKLRPRSRAQNGMHFPVEASNGKCIPVFCEKRDALSGRLLPAHMYISSHHPEPVCSQTFLPLLRHFVDRSVACLHARVYSNR